MRKLNLSQRVNEKIKYEYVNKTKNNFIVDPNTAIPYFK